jgi:hypothetical protein
MDFLCICGRTALNMQRRIARLEHGRHDRFDRALCLLPGEHMECGKRPLATKQAPL